MNPEIADVLAGRRRHPSAVRPFRQPEGRGPNGRRLCRWCWGEVAPRRSTFCSDECVHEYRVECDWKFARDLVLKRDHGVCVLCGTDTIWLQRALRESRRDWCDVGRYDEWSRLCTRALGCGTARDPWEADHIHARADGGSNHPNNLRTLCIPCHKRRTAAQATERASRRRIAEADTHLFNREGS